jgi:3-oxoacyl-[acyl-carrier-protein] synthase III
MKILSVRHAVPATILTNDDMIERIVAASRSIIPADQLAALVTEVREYLARVGTNTRHAADGQEAAIDVLRSAVQRALDAAKVEPGDLDFIIYAGVNRGWLEPSTAALVQREFAATKAVCFDVGEACASWVRAMQIAEAFFKAGTYKIGLIVNCECDLDHLATYDVAAASDRDSVLAAFTIGEAATATIVAQAAVSDLYITTRSFGQYCDLCMIPFANASSFLKSYDAAQHPPGRFYSHSKSLFRTTIQYLLDTYRDDPVLSRREHDIYFSHAASEHAGDYCRRVLQIPPSNWYSTHSRFGNTVAASIPLAMSAAIDEGRLERGARAMVGVGSAGISIALMSFTY